MRVLLLAVLMLTTLLQLGNYVKNMALSIPEVSGGLILNVNIIFVK